MAQVEQFWIRSHWEKRPRGRSRERWLDVVEEDLDKTGLHEWR